MSASESNPEPNTNPDPDNIRRSSRKGNNPFAKSGIVHSPPVKSRAQPPNGTSGLNTAPVPATPPTVQTDLSAQIATIMKALQKIEGAEERTAGLFSALESKISTRLDKSDAEIAAVKEKIGCNTAAVVAVSAELEEVKKTAARTEAALPSLVNKILDTRLSGKSAQSDQDTAFRQTPGASRKRPRPRGTLLASQALLP